MEHNFLSIINFVDLAIVIALVIFVIAGIIRGFTSDILGLGTWVGAFLTTSLSFPYAQSLLRSWIKQPFFADLTAAFVLFVLSLILLVTLAKLIARSVRKSLLSGLDRTFGIVSGAFRGVILLTLAYFIGLLFWTPGKTPAMLQEAKLIPIMNLSGRLMHEHLIPKEFFPQHLKNHLYGPNRLGKEDKSSDEWVDSLSAPKPGQKKTVAPKKDQKESVDHQNADQKELDALIKALTQ